MQLHISENLDKLSTGVADWLVQYIKQVLQKQDRFTIALSGGSTPKKLHELLVTDKYRNEIEWSKLHFFWGDERYVPLTDERSNAKMAYDTLLNHVPVNEAQIHIMRPDVAPEESAAEYEKLLHNYFDGKPTTFDLVLLGMGDDGHTLSLFPGKTEVIHEQKLWAISLWLESQNMYRITLTAPVVNKAACVVFLAAGANKTTVLKEVITGAYNPDLYPSQVIKPESGQLIWFVDQAAAGNLS
ncbi:6-phosphogluconolactonase [Filimonas lacunae]|uniref:6-phosphogluconolactonase n=1 Tax=Filimonas lacunae TaxID=477680 RepID=A0A173MQZ1_9BACT|nr:6-phosphogluconolactonase [Filimonas lacunae]BAV09859.1 6-phosphogluconolactonase, eukaryotic type [Filimonas lacunae]SIS80072.1 6-phosphogluconolactonase [Filimonas lacunae]